MIYSNVKTTAKGKDLGCGVRYYLSVGEKCKPVALWTEEGLDLQQGMNQEITVGINYRRKPCLLLKKDYHLYMFLYAHEDDNGVQRGEINVYAKHKANIQLIERFGQNKCVLLKIIDPLKVTLIRVRPYNPAQGAPEEWYVIHKGKVYSCTRDTLEECCKEHNIESSKDFDARGLDPAAENDWITL